MRMNIAIYGYGNLGRGTELAARKNPDIHLTGVFTRRDPESVHTATGIPVYRAEDILQYKDDIDVLIICGGSATDLPTMTPSLARDFNVVDSFDTHAAIPAHFANVDKASRETGHIALISAGWDPGMFSVMRLYAGAILPGAESYTFWGRGVSQGHSDAIRRVEGVEDARQYTVPIASALERVRSGENPRLTAREKHARECYVVAKAGADKAKIEREIKRMPNYFAEYDTTVHFISREELKEKHAALPHGGFVITCGKTGMDDGHVQTVEYRLKLDSNPEFTASVLVAGARAIWKMRGRGEVGCKTMLDIAPSDLSPETAEALRRSLL
ncbi:MAG: diaminopimelate dehydrogenase [Christensenellales bacterium]|jgi:diaminopimelate dehydrogenase